MGITLARKRLLDDIHQLALLFWLAFMLSLCSHLLLGMIQQGEEIIRMGS